MDSTTPVGAILAGIGPFIAFGTMANIARYKNRNEEYRVQFADNRYIQILQSVFKCMHKADRDKVPRKDNPFYNSIQAKVNTFIKNVEYYNFPKPHEFQATYDMFVANMNGTEAIRGFMDDIARKYLPDVYHVNSYLQENLVEIYGIAEEILELESEGVALPDGPIVRQRKHSFEC